MNADRLALVLAGALGFLAVALGAFGAHALKGWLAAQPDGDVRLAWWNTGVQYHAWHALLLMGVGVWLASAPPAAIGPLRVAMIAAPVGIALFSGSLYAMTLTGVRALGAITPLGGAAFLVAWGAVAWAAWRR